MRYPRSGGSALEDPADSCGCLVEIAVDPLVATLAAALPACAEEHFLAPDHEGPDLDVAPEEVDPRVDRVGHARPGPLCEKGRVRGKLLTDRPGPSACDNHARGVGDDDGVELASRPRFGELVVEGDERVGAATAAAVFGGGTRCVIHA